ncbi:acyl carrier protein [Streptomyces noboritoensis]|uniref:Acyl carrier protein n=1 Tax=Streptomyces noboritoensis TaxID=67337 RepID=A0ABV6TBF8_9ACTN
MTEPSDMTELVNAIIQQSLKSQRGITANQVLIDDLGFDSLKLFDLIAQLEDAFDITVSLRDVQKVKTVGDLHVYVHTQFHPASPTAATEG